MSTDAPAAEVDIKFFLDLINQVTLARYFAGIALTLCAYDWLILLERESQTVWKARWTRTKAIYYINRVMTLTGLTITVAESTDLWTEPLSRRVCRFYIWFPPMLQWASFCLGNTILTLRIVALYNRHKMIVRLAYSLLVLNWLMTLVFSVHTLYLFSLDIDYAPVLHLCVSNAHSPTASVIFIGPAVFEFILFLLTLYRALQDMKNRFFGANIHAPFLFILYRDGLYYFAAIFAVHLWNSLAYSLLPSTGIFMGVYFAWSVMTTMSSRVYLNLVLAAHGRGENALTTGGLSTVPAPQKYRIGTAERGSRQSDTFGGDNAHNGFTLTTFSTVPSSDPTEYRYQLPLTIASERLTDSAP